MACRSRYFASSDRSFRAYATPNQNGTGYVLDIQANLLQDLSTRRRASASDQNRTEPALGLTPAFEVEGQPYLMLTGSSPPCRQSAEKSVLSLEAHSDDIMRALDILLTGF